MVITSFPYHFVPALKAMVFPAWFTLSMGRPDISMNTDAETIRITGFHYSALLSFRKVRERQ
jgi:hypothetical protein